MFVINCFHDNSIHGTWINNKPFSLIEKEMEVPLYGRMKTLGDRIKARIADMGLTQKQAAAQVGISSQRFGNYAQDGRTPDIYTLAKIAKALDVSTDWLLGISENGERIDIQPVLTRLLELDGMKAEKALLLGEVAQEAVRLLSTLPDQAAEPATALLAAQAVWNSRLSSKPS